MGMATEDGGGEADSLEAGLDDLIRAGDAEDAAVEAAALGEEAAIAARASDVKVDRVTCLIEPQRQSIKCPCTGPDSSLQRPSWLRLVKVEVQAIRT